MLETSIITRLSQSGIIETVFSLEVQSSSIKWTFVFFTPPLSLSCEIISNVVCLLAVSLNFSKHFQTSLNSNNQTTYSTTVLLLS